MTQSGRTLITGGSGFIGGRLRQPGERVLTRRTPLGPYETFGDLLDPETLATACEGVDTIFHCAGQAHAFRGDPAGRHWSINFEGTKNLMTAAVLAGVRRFVFLSSVKAVGDPGTACADEDYPVAPDTEYGQAKRAAEDVVLEAGARHGLHVVNLRLAMVYGKGGGGNMARMISGVRAGWFPPLPETGNRRSLVHVEDVVRAMRLVVKQSEAAGKTYNIVHPCPCSGREIYDAIRRLLGKPMLYWAVPAVLLRLVGVAGDGVGALSKRPFMINSQVVSRLLDSAEYSPNRISRELGWTPSVDLEQGLREMLGLSVGQGMD